MTKETKKQYDASSITVLEGLQAVRERPGMYIGDTSSGGLHHLVYEVVDNCIDEAMAGYCTRILVTLHTDGSCTVEDDGRGIPVGKHESESKKQGRDVSAVEVVMTILHAGGKFDKDTYKVSGGLHGVGVSCVNALSQRMDVNVYRDQKAYRIAFERGKPVEPLSEVGETQKRGTRVRFWPDATIFTVTEFDYTILAKRLRELAFLNSGISIHFSDERDDEKEDVQFFYEGGLRSFVGYLNENKELLFPEPVYIKGVREGIDGPVELEVALQWNTGFNEAIYSYVNNIATRHGGTHMSGFSAALTRVLNTYIKNRNILKNDKLSVSGDDMREGLTGVISVKVPNPQFEGQTKQKLGNSDVASVVQQICGEELTIFLEENPALARKIADKAILSAQAREAARKARDLTLRKTALDSARLPVNLTYCQVRERDKCEIFIVEGDSAGGSAKTGRDRRTQAILPIRGKILNVEKARLDRVLESEQVTRIIAALGCGVGTEGFNLEKLRYHKVIIMTDADVDGSHIRTLLLTFFFRQMPALIENGFIYIGQPPLFGIRRKKGEIEYVNSEKEMDNYLLRQGLKDLKVWRNGSATPLDIDNLKQLTDAIVDVESFIQGVERKGIPFREFLAAANEQGQLPRYQVKMAQKTRYVYSDEQFAELSRALEEEQRKEHAEALEGTPAEERTDEMRTFRPKGLSFTGVHEPSVYQALEGKLSAFGLKLTSYSIADGQLLTVQVDEEAPQPIYTLKELMDIMRVHGRKGIEIQRYKGLGEMNADQLWDTTMDPTRRTLIRVRLEDAIAADHMFTMLMGDEVPPRRQFIETHALSVRNLDI